MEKETVEQSLLAKGGNILISSQDSTLPQRITSRMLSPRVLITSNAQFKASSVWKHNTSFSSDAILSIDHR